MTRKLLLSIFFFFKHSMVEFKVFQVFYKYIVLEHEKESHKKQIFGICAQQLIKYQFAKYNQSNTSLQQL